MKMADDDFITQALSSLSRQMSLANTAAGFDGGGSADDDIHQKIEAHAKSLVENDSPKVDSAVKSFLSLVAARSVVASEIDVLSENQQMKIMNIMDMKEALTCARKLLNGINTTVIPRKKTDEGEEKEEIDGNSNSSHNNITMDDVTHIIWNRLVENKDMKPSKVLGRRSLIVAYPFIEECLRRGIEREGEGVVKGSYTNAATVHRSHPMEPLPSIAPPHGIDKDKWVAYYTEFGTLLRKACQNDTENNKDDNDENEDDSKLLWTDDRGVTELQQRRDRRAKRAELLTQRNKIKLEE